MQPMAELLDPAGSPHREPRDSLAGKVPERLVLGREPVQAVGVGRAAGRSLGGCVTSQPDSPVHRTRLSMSSPRETVKKRLDRLPGDRAKEACGAFIMTWKMFMSNVRF